MEDLTFHTEKKKKSLPFLLFLPKQIRSLGVLSVGINLLSILLSGLFYPNLQASIPLFYSQPDDQQLVNKEFIFLLPILATLIHVIHLSILRIAKDGNQTLLRMFMIVTLALELLIFVILIRCISIVS
ncbi:hypothetical protein SDC9_72472 [bioreactor metagenome]|jgi:hypothetical protein|uniref:DUF1648 domain-containing protein n=1 Tax=bioreactor metagenome TaxID=1076179 RepID=A0A644YDL5_9ZZZZ